MFKKPLPCLKPDGLEVFTATPDQRLMLGDVWFERTHIPMTLRQVTPAGQAKLWREDQILAQLLDWRTRRTGNRVTVLFGAAGAGKSELMAWLERRIGSLQPERAGAVVRISRTELDLLSILGKFRHLLTGSAFDGLTQTRWEAMRRKPRTLSKLLVLRALESLLDNDDLIAALHYRLVDLVTPHIEALLNHTDSAQTMDVLSRDAFSALLTETALPFPFAFEAFRQKLIDGFREMMLDGMNLPDTLRALSDHFESIGMRPVLLIDDLVQSISVFATDLLDYFVTLEQGNWDVVVGITPASLQSDARGRDLLDRLTHLDTIDDRVDKLWLSDEQGFGSTFLDDTTSLTLTHAYLEAFRALNGVECVSCPMLRACRGLSGKPDAPILSPLTPEAVGRIFRSLPEGKGKVRALVRALRGVLTGFIHGQDLDEAFSSVARSDLAVEGGSPVARAAARWYSRLDDDSPDPLVRALAFFGVSNESAFLSITRVVNRPTFAESFPALSERPDSAHLTAVQTWLEGKPANRQLLHSLRQGAVMFLRGVGVSDSLNHPAIAKNNRALRLRRVELGVSPPMKIEDVDDYDGLTLSRGLGHVAFALAGLGKSTGAAAKSHGQKAASDLRALALIWEVEAQNERDWGDLEWELGVPLADFALHLAVMGWVFSASESDLPPGLSSGLADDIRAAREKWAMCGWLGADLSLWTTRLFDDHFRLRETVVDGGRVGLLSEGLTVNGIFTRLLAIEADRLPAEAVLGREPLRSVITTLQTVIQRAQSNPDGRSDIIGRLHGGESIPLAEIPDEALATIRGAGRVIYLSMMRGD